MPRMQQPCRISNHLQPSSLQQQLAKMIQDSPGRLMGSAAPELARQLPAFPVPPAAMTRTRRRTMAVSSQSEGVTKPAANKPSQADTGAVSC